MASYPRPLLSELQRQGFKRTWRSRSGDCEMIEYTKVVGDRRLELQLWDNGKHRVSHFLNDLDVIGGGRMSTLPSEFQTVSEMRAAIQYEWSRTDHPRRKGVK